jgi:formate-dependent phosphoribosylglycinamide formyltransferase (GAR transformylase)
VRAVGYPLIVKPRAAAGASGTSRADNDEQLAARAARVGRRPGHSVALEEFIEGHEGFYDTMSIIGVPVLHEFVSHYYPNVLEAMRTAGSRRTSCHQPPRRVRLRRAQGSSAAR